MLVCDLKKLEWERLPREYPNYNRIVPTYSDKGQMWIQESDVDLWVEDIIYEYSKKLNLSEEDFKEIFDKENKAFFASKKSAFLHCAYGKGSYILKEVKELVRVPKITKKVKKMLQNEENITAERFLMAFSCLNDEEKLEVLKRLKLIDVKVEYLGRL